MAGWQFVCVTVELFRLTESSCFCVFAGHSLGHRRAHNMEEADALTGKRHGPSA